MKKITHLLFLIVLSASYAKAQSEPSSDKEATKQTINLYHSLKKVVNKGFMIGHQDALAYGVQWKYEPGRSDIKDVTGDYPAVYGWELGRLEIGDAVNLDSVPFDKMRTYIQEGYQRGGVITISWHGNNPTTGKTAWNPEKGSVTYVLPGGSKNDILISQLDKIADFMLSLKGANGELIPVLFRPFHECTDKWFWWGTASSSDEEYKALFRFAVTYLRDTRKVHNLLYVYNTGSGFSNEKDYLSRYPGDDLIDILSFDTYQGGNAEVDRSYVKNLDFRLSIIEKLANEKKKIAVIGETGYGRIPYAKWWSNNLLSGIGNHKIAYVLFWRNADAKQYFVPFKGQASEQDFVDFYNLPITLFQKDITYKEMYE